MWQRLTTFGLIGRFASSPRCFHGQFRVVSGVPHNFWYTHPEIWKATVSDLCRGEVFVRAAEIDERGVADVVALAIGDDPQKIRAAVERYRDDQRVRLLVATVRGIPVGVVGYTVEKSAITLLHIATIPSERRTGLGRRLLAEVRGAVADLPLAAETDADSVGFYAATGFTITPLGEKYPGVHRFHARLNEDPRHDKN
ncbi:GCN5-related N-acetyltransferase [Mycolicibacterium rhodesiae JS60]|nr:GCN5-related N-acetyltransferase [Mycolicibacterium rhodesiae JS60]